VKERQAADHQTAATFVKDAPVEISATYTKGGSDARIILRLLDFTEDGGS
jgi:hypothetical protein